MIAGSPTGRSLAGIVLAAGSGRRFGGPKAIAAFRGEYLLDRAIRLLQSSGCDPCIVVLGADAKVVEARVDLRAARVVVADDWQVGMSASLKAGLAAASATDAGAAVVVLVDQPLIEPAAIRRLRTAWSDGAVAAVACYDGKARNPALLDRSLWSEVSSWLQGDAGARAWLGSHPELVANVECGDVSDPADVDTAEDLDRITRFLRTKPRRLP